MNKFLALLLVSLLVCQATAFSFRLSDSGEDHGEDSGEFSGRWSEQLTSDNGEFADSGEFEGRYFFYDNGEINIIANYSRSHYQRQDQGEYLYESDKISDSGEIHHVGSYGTNLSSEQVSNLVLKRLRNKQN